MKKIYNLIIASLVFVAIGCNDFLEKQPSDGIATDIALSTFNDIESALIGVYDGVQGYSNSTGWYAAQQFYRPDVAGDLMSSNGAGKRTSSDWGLNYNATNSPNMWNLPYNVIRRANNIIVTINNGKITDGTKEDLDNIKGQALTIRALAHFDLARNYGLPYTADYGASLGAPIIIEPSEKENLPARNTVAEMYAQIIKDLNEAVNLMYTDKVSGYLNQQGAKALLARVYLYKGENRLAFDTAEDLINTGGYKLWENKAEYASAWSASKGSSEVIWEIVNFNSQDWTDREGIAYLSKEKGYADFCLSKKASEYFEANPKDIRDTILLASIYNAGIKNYGKKKVWINKFPSRLGESDIRVGNSIVLRLSEQYLIAAEAAFKLGDQANADKYLNAIRKRAGLDDITATLENIIWEKGIEFIGEGHRLYDLMRNDMECDRSNKWDFLVFPNSQSVKFDRTFFRVILAIPQDELNVNPNMVQNPGYAS